MVQSLEDFYYFLDKEKLKQNKTNLKSTKNGTVQPDISEKNLGCQEEHSRSERKMQARISSKIFFFHSREIYLDVELTPKAWNKST